MNGYRVEIAPAANTQLRKLPLAIAAMLKEPILALGNNPYPFGARKLAGKDSLWRIRIGKYRVIYQVNGERLIVLIVKVGHRKDVYR